MAAILSRPQCVNWPILCQFHFATGWRYQMETFSMLLALCEGIPSVTGGFPSQRPATQSFYVFFDLRLNQRLSKQSISWWFETLSYSLWRHCNDIKFKFHTLSLTIILSLSLCRPRGNVSTAFAAVLKDEIKCKYDIDGLVQDCSNSIATTLKLLQSCTKPSTCWLFFFPLPAPLYLVVPLEYPVPPFQPLIRKQVEAPGRHPG